MYRINTFNTIIIYFLCICSIILYLNAPNSFSIIHCRWSFIIFIIDAIIVLKEKCRYNFLSFELPFTLGFGFVYYTYPLIYYSLDPYFSLFSLNFPEEYITRGTALASVAYSFLSMGFFKYPALNEVYIKNDYYIGTSESQLTKITIILLIIMIASQVPVYLAGGYNMDWGLGAEIRGVLESLMFYTIFQKFYLNRGSNIITLFQRNKMYFILVFIYVLLSTLIGNRGNIIRLGLLCFVFFNLYIKKLSNWFIISFLVTGLLLMYIIGAIRDSGGLERARENSVSAFDIGRDLTINNRSEYVLMEIADKRGYTYGMNFLGSLLSPIPFAQSTFLNLTGRTVDDISSGSLVTYDYFQKGDPDSFGLATNIVGDVYLAFGLLGVIILFYLLGVVVSKISFNANAGIPIIQYIYAILLMNTVIWVRSDFFKPLQMVLWGLALYYIFDKKRIKI